MPDGNDPLGDGETVYATTPQQNTGGGEDGPKYKDKQWLHHQYHELGKTQEQISESCDCSYITIRRWMETLGIELRDSSESRSLKRRPYGMWRDEDWLREQYLKHEKSFREIADEQDTTSSTISKWVKRFDIPTREEHQKTEYLDKKYKDPDWLEEMYWEEMKSLSEMADDCDAGSTTVRDWMDKYGIPRRTATEANKMRNTEPEVTIERAGDERELVVTEENSNSPMIDASWQYFHERPAAGGADE